MIRITIIIPVYKVEKYIEQCIRSVLNQTYRELEIIIVDDCSPDRSIEIAKECINDTVLNEKFHIIFLKHTDNRGLSAARNTGLDAATGDYVYFLDSDDEITEDCIASLVKPLQDYLYDFVVGGYTTTNKYKFVAKKDYMLQNNNAILNSFANGEWYVYAWNKLYNLNFLRKNRLRFREGVYHEDIPWSFHIAFIASSMLIIRQSTYLYRIRQDSISRADNYNKRFTDLLTIHKELYQFQCQHQRLGFVEDCTIRKFLPLLEETMQQLNNITLWTYYAKIRKTDCRTISQKKHVYNTFLRKLRYLDYFLPIPIGFAYRYIQWRLVRLKARRSDIPFVY